MATSNVFSGFVSGSSAVQALAGSLVLNAQSAQNQFCSAAADAKILLPSIGSMNGLTFNIGKTDASVASVITIRNSADNATVATCVASKSSVFHIYSDGVSYYAMGGATN